MSPLNLITSPIAAHAHGLLKHTCFFFFTGCICILSGSWGLRAFLIGSVLVGEELGSLPPSVIHLGAALSARCLQSHSGSWTSCCSSGPALELSPTPTPTSLCVLFQGPQADL